MSGDEEAGGQNRHEAGFVSIQIIIPNLALSLSIYMTLEKVQLLRFSLFILKRRKRCLPFLVLVSILERTLAHFRCTAKAVECIADWLSLLEVV